MTLREYLDCCNDRQNQPTGDFDGPIEKVIDQINAASGLDVKSRKQSCEGVIRQLEQELDIYRRILSSCEKRLQELNQA